MGRIIAGTIVVLLGISALFGVSLMKFALAFILIAIGIKILSGKEKRNWGFEPSTMATNEDFLSEVAIFSPVNKTVNSADFKGGKVVMVFSGGKIDLSQAKTAEKSINLEIVAVFGGGKIILPKSWKVNSQGTAIFGGYNNKVEAGSGETVLNLKGAAIFGGVEIVN